MEDYNKLFGVTEENWEAKIPIINRYVEIKKRLEELDEKSTRPLRAILAEKGTNEDKEFLNSIEAEAENLRKELKSLTDNSKANMYE